MLKLDTLLITVVVDVARGRVHCRVDKTAFPSRTEGDQARVFFRTLIVFLLRAYVRARRANNA